VGKKQIKRVNNRLTQLFGIVVAALAALPVGAESVVPAPAQGTIKCDRTCLKGFVDQYLAALVSHEPNRLPLSTDVRFTENTIRLNLGEGLWSTATGLGAYKIYVADPYSLRAGFLGVVMESGAPKLLSLRLQLKNGKITEIETIVSRQGLTGPYPPEMATRKTKPIWDETLDSSERVPRLDLIAAANQYFEGMEQNTGEVVPFDTSCNRTENGIQTTNNHSLKPPPGAPSNVNIIALGCKDQFNLGGVGIYSTPERRFWMVDEERGIVFGIFMFTVASTHTAIPITEMFKIKSGRLYEIEAVGVSGAGLPFGTRSGW
jgi:hypothetical protein